MENSELFEALGMTPAEGKPTPEQIGKVKGLGCLRDKRFDDIFNIRTVTRNGKITTDEARVLAEAADRFGSGEVCFTSRMSVEIQGVPYNNIPALIMFLRENGLDSGGTGPKVRPMVSCKGTTCTFGLIDTFGLSLKMHERFYLGYHDTALPHKFKMGVGGCPNNCIKPDLNDLGVIGQRVFTPDYDKCRGCAKCAIVEGCPMGAASIKDGKIHIDSNVCNHCGRCHKKCPFDVFETATAGYKVCIGGRWGKKTAQGKPLSKIFTSEEDVLEVIDKAICLFRDEGLKGERFADTINRLGFDYVEGKLIG